MNMNATVSDHGAATPPEKWTLRQQMDAQAGAQALVAMEAELRRQARELGAKASAVDELVQRARVTFRAIGGRVRPVAADWRTELRAKDGAGALSLAEWLGAQLKASPELFEARASGDGYVEPELPMRNPFLRKHWNLTEQMRLQKRDPERAARLKLEAWEKEG